MIIPLRLREAFDTRLFEVHSAYPALRVIAALYRGMAVLIAIITIISVAQVLGQDASNSIFSTGSIVVELIGIVTLLALAEGIKVFIDLEHNSRRIIKLLTTRHEDTED